MLGPPAGTVTFLFTDIEGSTKLAQQAPAQWEAARQAHHALMQSAADTHGGFVFQIVGDAFCIAFATAPAALAAALAAQRTLTENGRRQAEDGGPQKPSERGDTAEVEPHPSGAANQTAVRRLPSAVALRVRMGIHTGAAEYRDGDYHGYLTLAQAQRVMSVAHGGQMLVSNASAALLAGQLPPGTTLRDMGEHRLKGLANPERLWQVVTPDLPADFPPLASLNAIPNNLPLQLTSFVGRAKELAQVRQLLVKPDSEPAAAQPASRLVTLVGPGGTGKTRLSLQVAAELLDQFADGVWFIELAPLADPALVPATIAAVLDVRLDANRPPLAALADGLRFKQLLLILDNCEHLLDAAARAADALLHACPNVQLLASSREALGIAGETAFRVPSLSCPDPRAEHSAAADAAGAANGPEPLLQYDAVRLFIDRATAARSDFAVTNATAPAVAQICFRLDGIPLAIELAAARIKALRVEQIAARLDDRFRLLTGGSRTALPRQQTLRALIDWSYDLLSEPERVLLARLSVFAGGWTLEAAEVVCSSESLGDQPGLPSAVVGLPSADVLDLLAHLVDKSLVVMDDSAPDDSGAETRYHFLETIRQFAREKLLDSGDGERLRLRHLHYFDALSDQAEKVLRSAAARAWQGRLYAEQDNFRAALEWALARDPDAALRIATNLLFYWSERGRMTEGLAWLKQALTALSAPDTTGGESAGARTGLRARAYSAIAYLSALLGDNRAARTAADESIALHQTLADKDGLAFAFCARGIGCMFLGEPAEGLRSMRRGIALWREVGDTWAVAAQLPILSQFVVRFEGDFPTARGYLEEALRYQRALGDTARLPITLLNLSVLLRNQKEYAQSRKFAEESLQMCISQSNRRYANVVRSNLAEIARAEGHVAEAEGLYREVIAVWRDFGLHGGIARCLEILGQMALAQSRYEPAARLLAAAAALRAQYNADAAPDERVETELALQTIRAQLEPAAFETAWAQGSALDEERAIALATLPVPGSI